MINLLKKSIEVEAAACKDVLFDFIVIGSGAAGGATAITLADQGYHVLVVEAGPLLFTEHVGSLSLRHQPTMMKSLCHSCSALATWHHQRQKSYEQVWTVAGGRTLFWGGHAPRFMPEDFNQWPISYQELIADYEWAEHLLHVSDTFYNTATEEALMQCLAQHAIASQPSPLALEHQSQHSNTLPHLLASSISAMVMHPRFSNEISQRGLHLLCDTQAQRLQVNRHSVEALEVMDKNSKEHYSLRAKKYILACGAFRSTSLVMHSHLEIQAPSFKHAIGEHLFCKGLIELKHDLEEPVYLFVPPSKQKCFMFEIQGPFQKTWYDANYATVWLDWQQHHRYLLLYGFGVADVIKAHRLEMAHNQCGYKVNYAHTAHDVATLHEMQAHAKQIAAALEGKLVHLQFEPPGASLHERGGLMMGNDAHTSVVNSAGQFWSYPNLYCTDSAIWPNQGAANSCLTITAVAHHLTKSLTPA